MNHTTLNIFATLLASSTAMADLALQGLGTGPAPTSIGGYALVRFPAQDAFGEHGPSRPGPRWIAQINHSGWGVNGIGQPSCRFRQRRRRLNQWTGNGGDGPFFLQDQAEYWIVIKIVRVVTLDLGADRVVAG